MESEGRQSVSTRERVARVRRDLPPVLQAAGSAGLSYFNSTEFLGHTRPIFAALTAIIVVAGQVPLG